MLKGAYWPWLLAVAWQSAIHGLGIPPTLYISNLKHLPYLGFWPLIIFLPIVIYDLFSALQYPTIY